jgi:hypothetical protein
MPSAQQKFQGDPDEQVTLFAKYQRARSPLRPAECSNEEQCWVRDGPPALQRNANSNRCAGCGGKLRPLHGPTAAGISLIFNEQCYPSRSALARHLAPLTGRSAKACEYLLQQYGDDGARVLDHIKTPEKPQRRSPRRTALAAIFDGKSFPNRSALARHLAPLTGRSAKACWTLLARYGDADHVLEFCRAPASRHRLLIFNGQTFPGRRALARHLAPLTGRTVRACDHLLERYGDDGDHVLAHISGARTAAFSFNGQSFPSRFALARYLVTLTGRSAKACEQMLRRLGDDVARVVQHYQETSASPKRKSKKAPRPPRGCLLLPDGATPPTADDRLRAIAEALMFVGNELSQLRAYFEHREER